MTRHHDSLTTAVRHGLLVGAIYCAAVAALTVTVALSPINMTMEPQPYKPADPAAVQLAADLASGACWNDTGKHPEPRSAWYRAPDGTLTHSGPGLGLRIVFGSVDTDTQVAAFCAAPKEA